MHVDAVLVHWIYLRNLWSLQFFDFAFLVHIQSLRVNSFGPEVSIKLFMVTWFQITSNKPFGSILTVRNGQKLHTRIDLMWTKSPKSKSRDEELKSRDDKFLIEIHWIKTASTCICFHVTTSSMVHEGMILVQRLWTKIIPPCTLSNENDLKPWTRNNVEKPQLNYLIKIMLIYLLRKETVALLRSNGLSQSVKS